MENYSNMKQQLEFFQCNTVAGICASEDYYQSDEVMIREPGQKAFDPFQFVAASKAGDQLAESAISTLETAQQQKTQREKIFKTMLKFDDAEPWQTNLDVWRRKRKEKLFVHNDEISCYTPKANDQILHINSNTNISSQSPLRITQHFDERGDSGIDNRTTSTSELSPRSDLFESPKNLDELPPANPPPPPPVETPMTPEATKNIEITVELNKEQKANVSASKFPRNVEAMPRVYKAVDIPFDESPAVYKPKSNYAKIIIEMGSTPVHKGLGLIISKKDGLDGHAFVDSVIIDSPADKAGVLVGDRVVSINGENIDQKYQSGIQRILHEAARMGEASFLIERNQLSFTKPPQSRNGNQKQATFHEARSVFNAPKKYDSYGDFKRRTMRNEPISRDYNSLPRAASAGREPTIIRKRESSAGTERVDYRVSSFDNQQKPGKLVDFIPEIDRRMSRRDRNEDIYSKYNLYDNVTPRTIRNFPLSTENVSTDYSFIKTSEMNGQQEIEASAFVKRTTLPRKKNDWTNNNSDNDDNNLPNENRLRTTKTRNLSLESMNRRCIDEEVSRVSHRFFDQQGNNLQFEVSPMREIDIARDYKRCCTEQDTRNWRKLINDQRQSTPRDRRTSNLPPYIQQPSSIIEKYETDKYSCIEKKKYQSEDKLISVSGKHRCAHCYEELGRGSAMIVESLDLYYHLACFKCYVCKIPLGSGSTGADVRVRDGRLHCQTCYSNDRIQFSKV